MELLFDPVIPLLGLYPKNPEIAIQKNLFTPMHPGLWGLCVVAAMNKFTQTAEVLWRKRDGMATL